MVLPKLLRSRAAKIFGVTVLVPATGLGGLSLYINYRVRTRPQRVVFKPLVDKDGNLILEGKVIPRPSIFSVVRRVVELFFIFVPLAFLYVVMQLRSAWYTRWLHMLLAAVQRAGPVFVKIGQWMCTREDLFSREVRQIFMRLYNEVDVHPYAETLKVLREELGEDPLVVFERIEPTTVGSGSIGQVHIAQLRNSDVKVVIKVMHPNIVETIVRDFMILRTVAHVCHRVMPSADRYNLPRLADSFNTHLAAQLDFRKEAENLEIFRKNFSKTNYVSFPRPLMSTQRMLVETFCEGVAATPEFLASLPSHARDVLATKGLNAWCEMLLHDNFIHGDMHPGNILIDCSDAHVPKITLIDVGLVQQLQETEVFVTRDLMESFVRWNALLTVDSLWRMSEAGQKYADRDKFTNDIVDVMARFRSARNDKGAVTNVLQSIFECIRVNHIQMDPQYVNLLFAVLVLEAFIMNLNPEFNMVRHAAPWLVSEGHVSKGVVKNLVKTQVDLLKQTVNIWTGRMEDGMELEKMEKKKNIRVSEGLI
uniref:Ubiquinone biosynthesis protein n=1 Tax=Strigomonas galati TaxID=1003336 RepID=T1YSV3_9TRYP|nr:ubiquinone biosynthesis protein [Strigomonas galati]